MAEKASEIISEQLAWCCNLSLPISSRTAATLPVTGGKLFDASSATAMPFSRQDQMVVQQFSILHLADNLSPAYAVKLNCNICFCVRKALSTVVALVKTYVVVYKSDRRVYLRNAST